MDKLFNRKGVFIMFLKKKSEQGRSMVEMLGVLAIIGVLSIGGIAGYSLAMRRYRANQIVDAVNKYTWMVYDSCQKAIINGDITGFESCDKVEPYPSYQDSGLGQTGDRFAINILEFAKDDTNKAEDIEEVIITRIYVMDLNICKAIKNTLSISDGCADEGAPYYFYYPVIFK